jgi:hypothetical protein
VALEDERPFTSCARISTGHGGRSDVN